MSTELLVDMPQKNGGKKGNPGNGKTGQHVAAKMRYS